MDGVHDLGGMQGFGKVTPEPAEPVFHHPWERIVFGMTLAAMGQGIASIDQFRYAIESMDPAHYLGSSYYEHWLSALERVLVAKGIVTADELRARIDAESRPEAPPAPERQDPTLTEGVRGMVRQGYSSRREGGPGPRFHAGDPVIVRRLHPPTHTRCPRYVRGARGVIERAWGSFVLPDRNAHGLSEVAEPCYSVRFDARELWGPDAEGPEHIYVDLWESYLEPARTGGTSRSPRRRKQP
ncbi:MAG: nitrile hydratase subunit beta [Candidatus Binatota bacterium]|jgi:nitrile hydratase|nr:nitrile hydratase subunit beta [Candidatus Binatota bacterium]